ncbi:hypothetical protein NP856_20850 [Pseudomonas sp. 17391]|uniref:hypothetical protein n=1 Tax=Pseudomonas sp. 17391 TaxID=2967217 RepID=UPI0023641FC7|nr:hypothetical protein [Pseudomonas sp. 17391]MDD2131602.1 hypothetical protein [Pseudomonas sp. 17391]
MTEKIKIVGTPARWNDDEFDNRLEDQVKLYRLTVASMELARAPLPHDFLELVAAKVADGYTISRKHAVTHEALHHACYMIKPPAMQQEDIAVIRARVKEEYIAHLESERARYQDLLRQQLVQKQEEKERKAAETAKAKQLAQIEAEVQGCYSPLEIPA